VRTEELRLALVLNGGVSLAVWMSGVGFELNRLVRETHPVYRGLLQLTATAARIDVISGTSAGGVNGAALALAQIHDKTLASMRDVWLDAAGLEDLLRDPEGPEPVSLLRGDGWFLPKLESAFADLQGRTVLPVSAVPIMLNLTSTLLDGVVRSRVDDFGAAVEDRVHRACWHFERFDHRDDFARKNIARQLALAARSTASFPVAFEPVQFDPKAALFDGVATGHEPLRWRDGEVAASKQFLLDGGILDNKPFEAALDDIARLPASGNTRRVLAYVVPDPAASAEARTALPDGTLKPPTLAEVAWRSLVSIPATQSIATHMEAMRSHDDRGAGRWRRIVGAIRHVGAQGLTDTASVLLPAYRQRRVDGVVEYLLLEVERGFAASNGTVRRATRQWLGAVWRGTLLTRPQLWTQRVPTLYRADLEPLASPEGWTWGLYPLEFIAELTIEILRRTQRLRGVADRRGIRPDGAVEGPAADIPQADSRVPLEWADRGVGALRDGPRIGDERLQPLWRRAFAAWGRVRKRRRLSSEEAARAGGEGFATLLDTWRKSGGEQPPADVGRNLLVKLLGPEDRRANWLEARALCRILLDLEGTIADVLVATPARLPDRQDVAEAVGELDALRRYLYDPLPADPGVPTLNRLAARLLALEVFEVTASSRASTRNVRAELVQISARLKTAWGGSDQPAERLMGMQLGHFAAFYKRSWRANDWTFGRLDGIDRAIRIALNPDALQRRFGQTRVAAGAGGSRLASEYVYDYLHALAVASAQRELVPLLEAEWNATEIRTELRWLDEPSTVPPPVLELCAAALTRRLQLEALRFELPELARSLLAEDAGGAPPSRKAGAKLLAALAPTRTVNTPTPDDAVALVRANLLGSDVVGDQPGSDYFTRLASRSLATAHRALSSRQGGLNPIGVLFRVTALPVQLLYWLANRLSTGGTGAAVEGAVLAAGALLVAGGLLTDTVPHQAVTMGWALVVGVVAATLVRRFWIGVLLLAGIAIAVTTLVPSAVWAVGAVLVAVALLAQPIAVVSSATVVLLAAWWSAGGSTAAVIGLFERWFRETPVDTEVIVLVDRLEAAVVPAMSLIGLVALNALVRWARPKP
jgi:patatin-related protein